MLSGISDQELSQLYDAHCLFTLYPSLYEGWGLPVTESLCYGKVPLISDFSLCRKPVADLPSISSLATRRAWSGALDKLIHDPVFREEKEG